MKRNLLATDNSYTWTILRIALGVVILAHGLQKVFGWFGGFGWDASMNYFTGHVGLPSIFAAFIILIESLGAFLLIIGFAGRINAFLLGAVMIGAFFVDHIHNGFFMNWFGVQKGEGFEFDLLVWAMAAVLTVKGSGALSVDRLLIKNITAQKTTSSSVKYSAA